MALGGRPGRAQNTRIDSSYVASAQDVRAPRCCPPSLGLPRRARVRHAPRPACPASTSVLPCTSLVRKDSELELVRLRGMDRDCGHAVV